MLQPLSPPDISSSLRTPTPRPQGEPLGLLTKGVDAWNQWRSQGVGSTFGETRGRRIDLREAPLKKADLREINLSAADCCMADLRAADLRDANLREALFYTANLSYAQRRSALLRSAYPS